MELPLLVRAALAPGALYGFVEHLVNILKHYSVLDLVDKPCHQTAETT
jgi:hypothetical protein